MGFFRIHNHTRKYGIEQHAHYCSDGKTEKEVKPMIWIVCTVLDAYCKHKYRAAIITLRDALKST